jgi:hypothetical protein
LLRYETTENLRVERSLLRYETTENLRVERSLLRYETTENLRVERSLLRYETTASTTAQQAALYENGKRQRSKLRSTRENIKPIAASSSLHPNAVA